MPVLDGKSAGPAGPRVYVCRNYACQRPAESLAELAEHLDE
jgi:uncharacterized protein YyaL (SSP411 family)